MTVKPITAGKGQLVALAATLSLAAGIGAWAVAQNEAHARWVKVNVPRSLCEVLADGNRTEGETFMVRGTYYSAFEQSSFVCQACAESGSTWLEFEDGAWPMRPESVRDPGMGYRLVANLVVVGALKSEGPFGFGHLGKYKNVLRVGRVVEVDVLLGRQGRVPDFDARICKQ